MELTIYPLIQQIFIECFELGPVLHIGNTVEKAMRSLHLQSFHSGGGYRQLTNKGIKYS